MQCTAKLGHAVTAQRAGLVDAEDAVLVTVERHRFAPGLQIGAGGMEICKEPAPGLNRGRLAFDKLEMHQPARRIVDKHQQRALWAAVLEPPVLAPVDLHQFADALAPVAWLVDTLAPLLAVGPNPGRDQP